MTVLLLGGKEGIVRAIARGLAEKQRAVVVDREVDIGSMRAVRDAVARVKPAAVVLVGAMEDAEACEADPDRAFLLNAEGAIHLAAACLELKAVPVLLSTAEVFSMKGGPWSESDPTSAASAWARSKEKGEQFLSRANKTALVLRTGPIVFERGPNEETKVHVCM